MASFEKAQALLREFKGDKYLHGLGVLPQMGGMTAGLGKRAALVRDVFPGADAYVSTLKEPLAGAGVDPADLDGRVAVLVGSQVRQVELDAVLGRGVEKV